MDLETECDPPRVIMGALRLILEGALKAIRTAIKSLEAVPVAPDHLEQHTEPTGRAQALLLEMTLGLRVGALQCQ